MAFSPKTPCAGFGKTGILIQGINMKRIILFTMIFLAMFAINIQLSAQISPKMAKKVMAVAEGQKEKGTDNKSDTVEIVVPEGVNYTKIKGEFHGILIQEVPIGVSTEGTSQTEVDTETGKTEEGNDSGSALLNDEDLENLAKSPFSTIWNSFKGWVSNHIDVEKIDMWKIGYLFIGILITLIVGRTLRWIIERHFVKLSSKTNTEIDDRICEAVGRPVALFIFAIGIYLSSGPILSHLSPVLKGLFGRLCLATAAGSVAWGLCRLISVIDHILTRLAAKTDNNLDDLIVAIIRKSLKVTVVLLSILFIGQNILDMNITALLAGAGVLGLAIAFAAQDTIANFFGSIMIILDQPFKVGDCIQVSGFKGSVENVGFRSTRIRTFDGHLVSLPNKGVANDSIENIAKRPFIKNTTNLGLTYDTGYKNMERLLKCFISFWITRSV
jgi:small-conductance mechanosensitive channel